MTKYKEWDFSVIKQLINSACDARDGGMHDLCDYMMIELARKILSERSEYE